MDEACSTSPSKIFDVISLDNKALSSPVPRSKSSGVHNSGRSGSSGQSSCFTSSSPFSQLGAMSPGSAMSFSPSSFPFSPIGGKTPNSNGETRDSLNSLFSPSMFSPSAFVKSSSKVMKKRDVMTFGHDGIADLASYSKKDFASELHAQVSSGAPEGDLVMPPMHDPFVKTYDESFYLEDDKDEDAAVNKSNSARKKQRVQLCDVEEFLLRHMTGHDGTMNFLDDLNSTNNPKTIQKVEYRNEVDTNVAADTGTINLSSSGRKGSQKSSKTPARGSRQYFSSPATIVRPVAPPKMSPDMLPGATTAGNGKPGCFCKRSKCLKLYCECFKAQKYCNGCDCNDCNNLESFEEVRQKAIRTTKERNATAFLPKVVIKDQNAKHNAGCNCKKSHCIKKYCECYESGVLCSTHCKCLTCQNNDGSDRYRGMPSSSSKPAGVVTPRKPEDFPEEGVEVSEMVRDGGPSVRASRKTSTARNDVSSSGNKLSLLTQSTGDTISDGESDQSISSTSLASMGRKNEGMETRGKSKIDRDSVDGNKPIPLKKRKVKFATPRDPVYEFFGPSNPCTSKLTALRCLDFLDDKDIYIMSQVNKLWSIAAMDDALWE